MGIPPPRPWLATYEAERDHLLLARLRWCAALMCVGALVAATAVGIARPEPVSLHLGFLAAYGLLSVAGWVATRLRSAEGRGLRLAVGYILLLTAIVSVNACFRPRGAALASEVFVAELMGVMILLPWGVLPQAVVGGAVLAGYASVLASAPTVPDFAVICIVIVAVPVSMAGGGLLEHYRAVSSEHAWHQAQLIALARDLAETVEQEQVISRVTEHGVRLLAGDSAGISLYETERRSFRVAGQHGRPEGVADLTGTEYAEELLAAMVRQDTFVLPDEAPEHPLCGVVREQGARRVLIAGMRSSGELMGIFAVGRRADVPFGPGDRVLARGIADQAALALRTARVVADLRRASQVKSEFMSTMSHELRTPLNVILGYAEMAGDDALPAARRDECLERIAGAGRELLGLVESTLDIARIEAGRDEPRFETICLASFWVGLREVCGRIPRRTGVELDWREPAPPVALETDPRKLSVVMRNLVGNACKFTEQGGVCVEAVVKDGALALRVADTGIGIRPEEHEAIFEMFRQGDGSDSRPYGGAGLGLHIVRRFTKQLGGEVTVESAPGRGSLFTVRLPLRVAPRRLAAA